MDSVMQSAYQAGGNVKHMVAAPFVKSTFVSFMSDPSVAPLHALEAECQKIEDECGHTAALEQARRLSEIVRDYEAEIIALVPTSLQEAIDKANWCVWAAADDYCYLSDTGHAEAALIQALAAIGRASA